MSYDISGSGSLRSKRKKRFQSEINVVPYIDVMLVLLVIFMVVSPMTNTGVVDLPHAEKSALPPAAYIQISLHKDMTYELGLRQDKQAPGTFEKAANREEMLQKLREIYAKNKQYPVLIAADKDVRYEDVIQLISETKKAGVHRVGLATR